MHIVIEGADASGKSTLAELIAWRYGLPRQSSEGPGRSIDEINKRVERYLALRKPHIFDRHPVVSQPIYDIHGYYIRGELIAKFYNQPAFFIYCQPNIPLPHMTKTTAYDTPEHLANIGYRHQEIISSYRQWAIKHAHIVYRVPEPPNHLFAMLDRIFRPTPPRGPFYDIKEFHTRFALSYNGGPRQLTEELARLRNNRLKEEVDEYIAAKTLHDKLDALVDLTYIALGTAYMHGFDFDEAWRRVHQANMTKVRATSKDQSRHSSTYDIVKPADFVPPNLSDLC